jgi:hypothetical protein
MSALPGHVAVEILTCSAQILELNVSFATPLVTGAAQPQHPLGRDALGAFAVEVLYNAGLQDGDHHSSQLFCAVEKAVRTRGVAFALTTESAVLVGAVAADVGKSTRQIYRAGNRCGRRTKSSLVRDRGTNISRSARHTVY